MTRASAGEARLIEGAASVRPESGELELFEPAAFLASRLVIPPAWTTIPRRRVGRTIACFAVAVLRNLPARSSRKVRAPQRRVAGNARPPRGEDQCHRDVAPIRACPNRGVKRGKLCSEQGQIGGRGSGVRETVRSGGRGRAAQSSGRPLEPSGNRRPEMDDRRRGLGSGTELGLQAGSPPFLSSRPMTRRPRAPQSDRRPIGESALACRRPSAAGRKGPRERAACPP